MTAYTLFGQPSSPATLAVDSEPLTLGMQFTLSRDCSLTGIWFYSASGAGVLPAACAIWAVSGAAVVAGTRNNSPSWSGAAGSGWVQVIYDGSTTLTASTSYKVAVFGGDNTHNWYAATGHYWDSGPGAGGLASGPITAPANGGGDGGQDTFDGTGLFAYPATSFNATNYWADVQVTTAGGSVVPQPGGPVSALIAAGVIP